MPIEMPRQDPCRICEVLRGHDRSWSIVEERELCVVIMTAEQFERGQCIVVPRRHAGTLLDLTENEAAQIIHTAQRLMRAFIAAFDPLGVLLFQNNGVYSGQRTPHFHLHVVPRQPGSEWGVGPPQLARLHSAGRADPQQPQAPDAERFARVMTAPEVLQQRAEQLRKFLGPSSRTLHAHEI